MLREDVTLHSLFIFIGFQFVIAPTRSIFLPPIHMNKIDTLFHAHV